MTSQSKSYRVVLLDIDGTLIDSNDAHAMAWVDALAEFGRPIEFEEVRPLIGMGGDRVMPRISGIDSDSEEGERISQLRMDRFLNYYVQQLKPFPQVRTLLERLKADGFQLVVATSAKKEELDALLEVAGIKDLIEEATTSSDAEESKPSPDIVEAALKSSGRPSSDAIMIGDTPYDVESASKAGVDIVAFQCGGWGAEELAGALAVYRDAADLLLQYGSSPFSRHPG